MIAIDRTNRSTPAAVLGQRRRPRRRRGRAVPGHDARVDRTAARPRRSITSATAKWPRRSWPSWKPRPAAAGRSSNASIVHRLGRVPLGEASVAIAVSTPHRADAFAAGQWLIDTLKQDVPIWKQENWADGTQRVGASGT